MSITLETGPREGPDSVMERVRGFSECPFSDTSYGREEGPELPGEATLPATIGDPISEFCEYKHPKSGDRLRNCSRLFDVT